MHFRSPVASHQNHSIHIENQEYMEAVWGIEQDLKGEEEGYGEM